MAPTTSVAAILGPTLTDDTGPSPTMPPAPVLDEWSCSPNVNLLWVCLFALSTLSFLCMLVLVRFYERRRVLREYDLESGGEESDTVRGSDTDTTSANTTYPDSSASSTTSRFFVRNRCRACNTTRAELRHLARRLQPLVDLTRATAVTVMHEGQATRATFKFLEKSVYRLTTSGHDADDTMSLASSAPSATPTACESPVAPYAFPYPSAITPGPTLLAPLAHTGAPGNNDLEPLEQYLATLTMAAGEIGAYLSASDERRARAVDQLEAIAKSVERAAGAIAFAAGPGAR